MDSVARSNFACVTFFVFSHAPRMRRFAIRNEDKSLEVKEYALVKYLDD